jgi:hypothetical protein
MAERLESIGRKIGLKFMGAPVHGCYYLSTEMFYVEINIDSATGDVNEAKIHHIDAATAQQQPTTHNCPGRELTKLKQSFKQRFETCVKKSRLKQLFS